MKLDEVLAVLCVQGALQEVRLGCLHGRLPRVPAAVLWPGCCAVHVLVRVASVLHTNTPHCSDLPAALCVLRHPLRRQARCLRRRAPAPFSRSAAACSPRCGCCCRRRCAFAGPPPPALLPAVALLPLPPSAGAWRRVPPERPPCGPVHVQVMSAESLPGELYQVICAFNADLLSHAVGGRTVLVQRLTELVRVRGGGGAAAAVCAWGGEGLGTGPPATIGPRVFGERQAAGSAASLAPDTAGSPPSCRTIRWRRSRAAACRW